MKIVIPGGSGQVGTALARAFQAAVASLTGRSLRFGEISAKLIGTTD